MEFTIELNDINDEFPEFEEPTYNLVLPESEEVGSSVLTVKATDKDAGDKITYTLVPSTQFQVDSETGVVTVNKVLDYETTPELNLQLTATDAANHRDYADLVVTLTDVNDESPSIVATPALPIVDEDSEEGEFIAEVSATDPDTEPNLELSIDWENTFATKLGRRLVDDEVVYYKDSFKFEEIRKYEGEVILNLITSGNPKLDWGKLDTIYLMLVVTDTNTAPQYAEEKSKATVTLTITVNDTNNNPPVFNEVPNLKVKEEEEDYPIVTMVAVDADGPGNNDVKYSIAGADPMYDDYVKIDPKTGEIRTIKKIDCDIDGYATVSLNVTATDGLNDNFYVITVDVIDINDNDPVFGDFSTSVSIPERTESGTEVLQIIATDNDLTAPFNTITYQMKNTDENQLYFTIDGESGMLSVKLAENRVLRREDRETFTIGIVARDNFLDNVEGSGGSRSAETTITINLLDINDNTPEFPQIEGCFVSDVGEITEETKKDTKVGTVTATDTDYMENGTVSYSILSIKRANTDEEVQLFQVAEDSGEVTATEDLLDKWGEYIVSFQASDHGSPPLSGTIDYTFCVIDINNNDPEFVYPTDGEVIRLSETQSGVGKRLKLYGGGELQDFTVTDKDDISTGNGRVTLTFTGGAEDVFEIIEPGGENTFRLVLKQPLSEFADTSFTLTLIATDGGQEPRSSSITIDVKKITEQPREPEFVSLQWLTDFTENSTGLEETREIPSAIDANNVNLPPEDQEEIFYFIVGGDEDFFQLDSKTRILSLKKELDYEKAQWHSISVRATNSKEIPDNPFDNLASVLEIIVNVTDVNDMPPVFDELSLTGGFTTEYSIETPLFTIKAIDPDVDDKVTYKMISAITASSDSLAKFTETGLELDETGVVILNLDPKDDTLDGYLSFVARAMDSKGEEPGHYADAEVQVYVISNIHRVTFQFLNNKTDVDAKEDEMETIFSDVFKYSCSIEDTKKSTDPSSGVALEDSTDVVAYFIDPTKRLPVERDVITRQFYEQDTYIQLQYRFGQELELNLKSYQETGNKDATNIEGILTIILIVVSAVLGTMVIVLFVAFFLRTKTLKRRLEALQELQFGSQNSGLNRVGVAVPNTNKHAVEGSNPMWKTEEVIDYDNASQGSGDSDLIGIEDNPEFQPSKNKSNFLDGPQPRKLTGILNKEFTFHPDDSDDKLKTENQYLSPDSLGEGQQPRRITETLNNNFILQYDTDANDVSEKPQSVNPLANGNLKNTDNYEGNDNFSFKPADSVPITEL